jgi:hypothetical protein
MKMSKQKAKLAVQALRAVGIESARAGDGDLKMVTISPEDAMKMLLLTDQDRDRLLSMEKVQRGVLSGIGEVKSAVLTLEKLVTHTFAQCERGDHILDSYATGGRDGHVITRCLACSYKTESWD